MNSPYGGRLVNLQVSQKKALALENDAKKMHCIELDLRSVADLEMLANGAYSPLDGFMGEENFASVLEKERLANGLPWSIPIVLPVSTQIAKIAKKERFVALQFKKKTLAVMSVEDIFRHDKKKHALMAYGTNDKAHPGVAALSGNFLLGGRVQVFAKRRRKFEQYFLDPATVRTRIFQRGWKTIAAFQTRNAPHRGHEYLQLKALEQVDGLLIHPVIGVRKKGDTSPKAVLESYELLIKKYFPKNRVMLAALPMAMRYAGPKEAVLHAIIRRNFGCTHFIVGRDHAGVGDYYGKFSAQKLVAKLSGELGITPIFFPDVFHCFQCKGITDEKKCLHEEKHRLRFSGTQVRNACKIKTETSSQMMRPEISKIISQAKCRNNAGAGKLS